MVSEYRSGSNARRLRLRQAGADARGDPLALLAQVWSRRRPKRSPPELLAGCFRTCRGAYCFFVTVTLMTNDSKTEVNHKIP